MVSIIVQRIAHDIYKHDEVYLLPDEGRVNVYTLVLKEIKRGLERRKPREAPQSSLNDYEDALYEIQVAFTDLEKRPIGKKYRMKQCITPHIKRALIHISRAMTIIESDEKTLEYFQCLVELQQSVSEAYYYLHGG